MADTTYSEADSRPLPAGTTPIVRDGALVTAASKIENVQRRTGAQQLGEYFGRNIQTAKDVYGGAASTAGNLWNAFPLWDLNKTLPTSDAGFEGVPMFDPSTGAPTTAVGKPVAPQRIDAVTVPTYSGERKISAPSTVREADNAGEMSDKLAQKAAQAKNDAFDYAHIMSMAEQEIAELNRLQLAAIQEGANEVAAQYDEAIAEEQEKLAKAKQGLADSMAAYDEYSRQAEAAYDASIDAAVAGEAEMADEMDGRADRAVATIEQGYDATVEDVHNVAEMIGLGNVALGESLGGAVEQMERILKNAAAGGIEDLGAVAEAGAFLATKTAEAVAAQDEYMTDVEQEKTRIQVQSQIDQYIENIADLESDKKKAVQKAMDAYDPLNGFDDPEEAWAFIFDTYLQSRDWDLDEIDNARAIWGAMSKAGVTDRASAAAWINEKVAEGIENGLYDAVKAQYGEVSDQWMPAIEALAADPNGETLEGANAIRRFKAKMGLDITRDVLDALGGRSEYEKMLDIVDLHVDHVRQWDERKYVKQSTGATANNNWANRNNAAYVHRRNVAMPNFVNSFLAAFGKTGTGKEYVGGVTASYRGISMDPQYRKGANQAANSDHHSGGAVDLYGDTVAELEAIARWADKQPGVSYVTYWGAAGHETGKAGGGSSGVAGRGHVHVSLQV